MPVLTVPPSIVLLPMLLVGAWIGLRRGWKDEAWTLGALLVTIVIFVRPERALLPILERLIAAFQRAGQALLGRDTGGESFQFAGPSRPWASLLAFLLFVALAYALGHLLGKSEQGKGLWKLLAILLGGVNVVIVVTGFVSSFVATRQGSEGLRLVIPSFDGAAVVLGTPNTNNIFASWPGLIGLLLVFVLIVFILTRTRVWR